MSKTFRYNPDTFHKDMREHHLPKHKRTKEEKELLYRELYTPKERLKFGPVDGVLQGELPDVGAEADEEVRN